jgi:hypothetical protein
MVILQLNGRQKPDPPKCSKLWFFRLTSVLYDEYVFLVEHQVALWRQERMEKNNNSLSSVT